MLCTYFYNIFMAEYSKSNEHTNIWKSKKFLQDPQYKPCDPTTTHHDDDDPDASTSRTIPPMFQFFKLQIV